MTDFQFTMVCVLSVVFLAASVSRYERGGDGAGFGGAAFIIAIVATLSCV